MVQADPRPLVFLDVDGTLVTIGPVRRGVPGGGTDGVRRVPLDPALGRRLAALPADLVWATTWGQEANSVVAPLVGLGRLPVVGWPTPLVVPTFEDLWPDLHWKTPTLVAWAEGREFVWIDDEITDVDRAWVAENSPSRALLLSVDPLRGVTAADLDRVEEWIRASELA